MDVVSVWTSHNPLHADGTLISELNWDIQKEQPERYYFCPPAVSLTWLFGDTLILSRKATVLRAEVIKSPARDAATFTLFAQIKVSSIDARGKSAKCKEVRPEKSQNSKKTATVVRRRSVWTSWQLIYLIPSLKHWKTTSGWPLPPQFFVVVVLGRY